MKVEDLEELKHFLPKAEEGTEKQNEQFMFNMERELSYTACFFISFFLDPIEDIRMVFPQIESKYCGNENFLALLDVKRFLRCSLGWEHYFTEKTIREVKIFLKSQKLCYNEIKKGGTKMGKKKAVAKKAVAKKGGNTKVELAKDNSVTVQYIAEIVGVGLKGVTDAENVVEVLDYLDTLSNGDYTGLPAEVKKWHKAEVETEKKKVAATEDEGKKVVKKVVKKKSEKKVTGKKVVTGKPEKKAGDGVKKVKYTRSHALVEAFKKGGTKQELIERANNLYTKNGGTDNIKVASALLNYVLLSLLLLNVVEETDQNVYRFVKG